MESKARSKLIDMKRQLTPNDIIGAELKSAFTKRPANLKKFKGRMARLKGMLTQWEPFRVQIERYIDKKSKESKNLPEKIDRLKQVLQDECAHPVDTLEVLATHIRVTGDPVSNDRTEYVVKCTLCGKSQLGKTIVHNNYGT